jgi:hypothetical protein
MSINSGRENETRKIPDDVVNNLINIGLFSRDEFDSDMLNYWRECKMSTLCTAFPSFPSEGDIPLNTLKNCAKTTAKINVQDILPIEACE